MNEVKGKLWTTLGLMASAVIAIAFIGQAGGCEAVQDTIARAIGSPTSEDRRVVAEQIEAAETKAEESEAIVVQLQQAIEQTDQAKAEAEERQELIRQSIASAAAQLPTLKGVAADALMDMIVTLQTQLRQAKDDMSAAASTVALYRTKIAEHQAALVKANEDIETLSATLAGFDQRTAGAIANTVGLVKFAGDTANTLGIPGAAAAGDMAGAVLGGLLTTVLGGTAAGAMVRARRSGKKASALEQVVQMTEKLGLIRDDPEAKKAKDVARKELGADVMSVLHAATAKVQ